MIIAISMYELYDLYDIFCLLRSQIVENKDNFVDCQKIVEAILNEFECCDALIQPNVLRKKLRYIKSPVLEELWRPLYVDNVYTYFGYIIKDKENLSFLVQAIRKLYFLYQNECSQKVYEFLDTIHFLPILLSEQRKIPQYIKKKIQEVK